MSSLDSRYSERNFRRWETVLLEAFHQDVGNWAVECRELKPASVICSLNFAVKWFLHTRPDTLLDFAKVNTRLITHKFDAAKDLIKGCYLVSWHPRKCYRSKTQHEETLRTSDTSLHDEQSRIDRLQLSAHDKEVFRAAIRALHYGLLTGVIILHGKEETWMRYELQCLENCTVDFAQTDDSETPRIVMM